VGGLIEHVFGYGSLAGELLGGGSPAWLHGYRRTWGVAADNVQAIPGYKQYRLRSDGSTPPVFVAFLDLAVDPGCAVNGVVAHVDESRLAELDRRERNYDRVDVTASVDCPVKGRIWTYVGSPEGRARLAEGVRGDRIAVSREYAERVHAAFRAIGDEDYERFLASSDLDGLPVMDLERVDLPPEARR